MSDKQQPQLPSPDVVRDLVKVGVEQIRVRKQELDLQEKDSQRQYDFAKQALSVQAEDRRHAREHRRKRTNDRYLFVGVLFLLGVAMVIALSYMDKDALAMEVTKLAATFLAGGLSGYGLSKARARPETDSEEDSDADANA
jgi:VIT1/CCC1 family predicted Fe2+/Mn2+ transporter